MTPSRRTYEELIDALNRGEPPCTDVLYQAIVDVDQAEDCVNPFRQCAGRSCRLAVLPDYVRFHAVMLLRLLDTIHSECGMAFVQIDRLPRRDLIDRVRPTWSMFRLVGPEAWHFFSYRWWQCQMHGTGPMLTAAARRVAGAGGMP